MQAELKFVHVVASNDTSLEAVRRRPSQPEYSGDEKNCLEKRPEAFFYPLSSFAF